MQGKLCYTTNSVTKIHISNHDRKPKETLQAWGDILNNYSFVFYIYYFFFYRVHILGLFVCLFLLLIPGC